MSLDEVRAVARAGGRLGCREALFVLGERPEERYPEARDWLRQNGYDSTVEYLAVACRLVLDETPLYPHTNAGTLSLAEMSALKGVNVSMGLMMENLSPSLSIPGGVHEFAPSKAPGARMEQLRLAGTLRIPFTTGILVGIGETREERWDTLAQIQQLNAQYGHIQEIIIQPFLPKESTSLKGVPTVSEAEMIETIALARICFGPEMNIQAPPNLIAKNGWVFDDCLVAGVNDWGGISPLTRDYVNPEASWPELVALRGEMSALGRRLQARYPIYPQFIRRATSFLSPDLARRISLEACPEGFLPKSVSDILFTGTMQ